MNEDRRKILEMLASGKITAEEADRLLAALDRSRSDAAASGPKRKPQFLRVLVEDENAWKGPVKVNVRVPMQLLRAGVRLASLIPPEARDRVNWQLRREGVPFDLNQITPDNLEELVEHLDAFTLDIDERHTKVRLFCE
ncbi:MAG TPA: hypothetical protein VHW09_03480 [Bryobacteraceae bacterium]|jgi:polyhydroxyalkanoate synthesis regulator phasin|nr:hypothetical protein [Bryobacteraceae bacterium]